MKMELKEILFEVVDRIKLEATCETQHIKLCCGQFLDRLNNSPLVSKDTARMRWSEFQTVRLLAAVRIEITKILLYLMYSIPKY